MSSLDRNAWSHEATLTVFVLVWTLLRRGNPNPFFCRLLCRLAPAQAGSAHRLVGARLGKIEPRLDQRGLERLAAPGQAFVQAVQASDVVGMPAGPADGLVEAEIGAIDGLGLGEPALL